VSKNHLKCNNTTTANSKDVVYTPSFVAEEIVQRYKPTGKVLDPCAGDGVFRSLIPNCLWCEVKEGKDFFDWNEHVDWIIGNPPYSILNQWLQHSFSIADNIVYLLPIAKVFGSRKRLQMISDYGGMVEVYAPWTGRAIGFEFGWACGTVHFKRNHGQQMNLII
tara:strand:+ start:129 stop:620 length:492 start_codon:yes stop_codon:yes gene_type:complete